MSIKLEIEKVVVHGDKFIKLISAEMLTASDLPNEYLRGSQHVYLIPYKKSRATIKISENPIGFLENRKKMNLYDSNIDLDKEILFQPEVFTKFCEFLKECGQRLHEINKRLREENKNWKGTSTIEI